MPPPDGEPVVLPKPEFTLTDTGFVIKNWSLEQLTALFKAKEFTKQWYKKPQDKHNLHTIRPDRRIPDQETLRKEVKAWEDKRNNSGR